MKINFVLIFSLFIIILSDILEGDNQIRKESTTEILNSGDGVGQNMRIGQENEKNVEIKIESHLNKEVDINHTDDTDLSNIEERKESESNKEDKENQNDFTDEFFDDYYIDNENQESPREEIEDDNDDFNSLMNNVFEPEGDHSLNETEKKAKDEFIDELISDLINDNKEPAVRNETSLDEIKDNKESNVNIEISYDLIKEKDNKTEPNVTVLLTTPKSAEDANLDNAVTRNEQTKNSAEEKKVEEEVASHREIAEEKLVNYGEKAEEKLAVNEEISKEEKQAEKIANQMEISQEKLVNPAEKSKDEQRPLENQRRRDKYQGQQNKGLTIIPRESQKKKPIKIGENVTHINIDNKLDSTQEIKNLNTNLNLDNSKSENNIPHNNISNNIQEKYNDDNGHQNTSTFSNKNKSDQEEIHDSSHEEKITKFQIYLSLFYKYSSLSKDIFLKYLSISHKYIAAILPYPYDLIFFSILGYILGSLLLTGKRSTNATNADDSEKIMMNLEKKFKELSDLVKEKVLREDERRLILMKFNPIKEHLDQLEFNIKQEANDQLRVLEKICDIQSKVFEILLTR